MVKEFLQSKILSTERLLIRRLKHNDINPYHEMQGNMEVMQYVAKKANTREENIKDLAFVIDCYDKSENTFWVWAIENQKSGDLVGTFAIIKDKEDNWEIGYRFLQKFWGKGYATESVLGVLKLCESIDGMDNLIAYADLRNVGSQKVLSKTGFVNLGIKYNDEEECEDYIYSISIT